MDKTTQIVLECSFCKTTKFEIPNDDYCPKDGETIKCSRCGKENDVTALRKVAEKKGMEWAKNYAGNIIKDFVKDLNKKLKF